MFPASLRSYPVELYAGLNAELYLIEQHNMQFLSSTPHYDNTETLFYMLPIADLSAEGVTRERVDIELEVRLRSARGN